MTNPVADFEVPDVEAALWADLGTLGGVRLWTYDVQEETHGWVTFHSVQVDARAANKKAAHDKAWVVRAYMIDLPGTSLGSGRCVDVAVVSGPSWLPDENGAPRYVARYTVGVRPGPENGS